MPGLPTKFPVLVYTFTLINTTLKNPVTVFRIFLIFQALSVQLFVIIVNLCQYFVIFVVVYLWEYIIHLETVLFCVTKYIRGFRILSPPFDTFVFQSSSYLRLAFSCERCERDQRSKYLFTCTRIWECYWKNVTKCSYLLKVSKNRII